jgi:hypothetical protein
VNIDSCASEKLEIYSIVAGLGAELADILAGISEDVWLPSFSVDAVL